MTRKVPETDLAKLVIAHLENAGGDVYQEVACGSGFADIVARFGAELWIVEVKATASVALILQALERRRYAHRVYVATPRTKSAADFLWLCSELGIGLIEISYVGGTPIVREVCDSRRWNTRPVKLTGQLSQQHKTHAPAGTNGGGRWSPFLQTSENLRRVVANDPGITLKAAIAAISHHYTSPASARSSIAHWARAGKIDGVSLKDDTGAVRLYPRETRKAS